MTPLHLAVIFIIPAECKGVIAYNQWGSDKKQDAFGRKCDQGTKSVDIDGREMNWKQFECIKCYLKDFLL